MDAVFDLKILPGNEIKLVEAINENVLQLV
jgi:hypothetical protein